MRRQLKPFVTEYRGNARRAKDLQQTGDFQEASVPRAREPARTSLSDPPEDAYEAAMRAADALFAPAPRRDLPQSVATHDDDGGGLVAPIGAAVPPDKMNEAPPRRILQALEPVDEDRFSALEAERAPRRRGRKPGSKNKPKLDVSDDWAGVSPAAAIGVLPAKVPSSTRAVPRPIEVLLADTELAGAVGGEPVTEDAPAAPQRARSDKFGWKRAGLRPGERWKRRLPRVAW